MKLHDCLTEPIKSNKWGGELQNPTGALYYRDNGADVLAVAHLDAVMVSKPTKEGPYVFCPQLDDRLGVWVLLYMLPKIGVNVDVLLTDCEEVGQSTAQHFPKVKDYNWMVEFDRKGTDFVMYDYEHHEYIDALERYGIYAGWGSFSDICYLEHLGVVGFNIGTGYYQEHSKHCWANLNDTRRQARIFAEFWNDYKDIPMPIVEKPAKYVDTYNDWWLDDKGTAQEEKKLSEYTRDEWWEIDRMAEYYGYGSAEEFIKDGGLSYHTKEWASLPETEEPGPYQEID